MGTESFLERSEVWMDANKGVGIKAVETMEGKENLEGEKQRQEGAGACGDQKGEEWLGGRQGLNVCECVCRRYCRQGAKWQERGVSGEVEVRERNWNGDGWDG